MIYTFKNTHVVMKAGKKCYQHNIQAKVIPTPRHISSGCGVSLVIMPDYEKIADELFVREGLEFGKYIS